MKLYYIGVRPLSRAAPTYNATNTPTRSSRTKRSPPTNYASRKTLAATPDSQETSPPSHPQSASSTSNPSVRISYGQFMSLFSKTVAERTKPGQRQDVEEKCTPFSPHPLIKPSPSIHLQQTTKSLYLPRLRPHRRRRRHHHQRPRLPSPSSAPTPLQSRRRIPLPLPPNRVRERNPDARFPTLEGIYRQVSGSAAGGQHHEDPEGVG